MTCAGCRQSVDLVDGDAVYASRLVWCGGCRPLEQDEPFSLQLAGPPELERPVDGPGFLRLLQEPTARVPASTRRAFAVWVGSLTSGNDQVN